MKTVIDGRVQNLRLGAVGVKLSDGRVIQAKNTLNARTPPAATVLCVEVNERWYIVGRRR